MIIVTKAISNCERKQFVRILTTNTDSYFKNIHSECVEKEFIHANNIC